MTDKIIPIQKFLDEEKINGTKPNTIRTYISFLRKADEFKAEEGGLSEAWTRDDINAFIRSLQDEKYAATSIEVAKGIMKKFWRWAGKPEIAEHLKVKMPEIRLRRDQILTVEDVNKMIEASKDLVEQALVAFLFESAGRINEVLPVLVGNVKEVDGGLIVPIHETKSKEDFRDIACVFSAQYIRNLIQVYHLKPEDRLFPMVAVTAWRTVKKLGKEAGIKKPISPHKFRHAGITDMTLRGYPDAIIKKKVGHSENSRQTSRYTHICADDVIKYELGKNGHEKPKERITASELKVKNTNLELEVSALREKLAALETRVIVSPELLENWLKAMKKG